MHISLHTLSQQTVSLFQKNVLPALTAQQKKILAIALVIFGCLTGLYVLKRCCFKGKEVKPKEASTTKQKTKIYADGVKAEGTFINDVLEGKGKVTLLDGSLHEGIFEKGEFKEGKITQANGIIFVGKINGKLATGTVTTPEGTQDEGDFKEGRLTDGPVKITLPDGTIYEGSFKDWEITGKMIHPNGTSEEGEFKIFNNPQEKRIILKKTRISLGL